METSEQREEQRARNAVKADYCAPREQEWIQRNAHRVVAIDIDGTMVEPSRWLGEGYFAPIMPRVKSRIKRAKANGWIVVIYSVRKDKERIANFLNVNKIPFDFIETKPCYYTILVDDRAVPFDGDWSIVDLPPRTLPMTIEEKEQIEKERLEQEQSEYRRYDK